jgi:hypothetical protein
MTAGGEVEGGWQREGGGGGDGYKREKVRRLNQNNLSYSFV